MEPNLLYFWSLHIGCLILFAAVIILAVKLKKANKTIGQVISSEALKNSDEERALLEDIEKGLQNGEFKMYLQFIVDNKEKKLVSAEALSRWEKSNGEVFFPGKYIGIMEKFGVITKLDYLMFEKACEKLSRWKDTEFADFSLSCNFTRLTISEKDFISKIEEICGRYDFDRRKLLIEITEDSMEKNTDIAMKNILYIKEIGFRTALDDIGSGYTSFVNLSQYPIDVAKIDRSILLLANSPRGKKLFLGMISLAHFLNLKVICEGVETEEQNALVSDTDCDYIQGWYYSKALPEKDAESFAQNYMKIQENER